MKGPAVSEIALNLRTFLYCEFTIFVKKTAFFRQKEFSEGSNAMKNAILHPGTSSMIKENIR